MKIIFSLMLISVLLGGCNLEFLQSLKTLNDKYCSETNADKRRIIIDAIRLKEPNYPEEGLCGVENVIAEKIS